jgi:hypothetical protein
MPVRLSIEGMGAAGPQGALAWLASLDWQSISTALQYVLGLGVVTAIVTAVLTSRRETTSRALHRRSELARQFLDSLVEVLSARLQGAGQRGDRADAQLVFAHRMLSTEKETDASKELLIWIDEMVRQVRYEQPPPLFDDLIATVGSSVFEWVRDPRKALPPK